MKIVCKKSDLSHSIALTLNAVSSKSTLPVLGNLLFEAQDNELTLTGTDLEIGLKTKTAAEVIQAGAVTIPGKKILEIVRECSDQDIEITVSEGTKVAIQCGKSKFKIMGLAADDFPNLPQPTDGTKVLLKEMLLLEMIKKTSFSVSTDETRYVLNGALFSVEGKEAIMVTTDGHRLSMAKREMETPVENIRAVLPTKALTELTRVLENSENLVSVQFSNNHLFLEKGTDILVTRLIDGQFPNYEQVVPKGAENIMKAQVAEFAKVVRRVSLMASDKSRSVKFSLSENKLTVSAQTPDVGEAEESMDVEYTGEAMTIAFNGHYVSDVLKAIETSEVALKLKSALSPGLLLPVGAEENNQYVIMPMRT